MWLQAKGIDSLADPAFNSEKVLINLFLRYNTAMPSSASVERLFSLWWKLQHAHVYEGEHAAEPGLDCGCAKDIFSSLNFQNQI